MGRPNTNALRALMLLSLVACSATRSVRPVGKHHGATAISVGGPLFVNLGPPLPVPIPVLSGRYGVTAKTDVDVGVLLPLVPTMGLDVGASHEIVEPLGARPLVMAGARLMWAAPLWALRASHVLLEAHGTASWTVLPDLLGYVGLDVLFDTMSLRWHPTSLVGVRYQLPTSRLSFSAEGRFLAMGTSSDDLSVIYGSFGGRGAVGVALAVVFAFDLGGGRHGH